MAPVALLAVVLGLSLWARWPVFGLLPPGEDKALNARYLADLRAGKALPERDLLMLGPAGRAIGEQLPLGLYRAMQAWTALTPASDPDTDRLRFGALAALLFVAALLWLGFEAGGGWRGAIWTGLLALAIPSLTLRTSAAWLRWEVAGAAALVVYAASSARALRLGTWVAAPMAAFSIALAAWLWRPSLTLAPVALVFGWALLAFDRLDARATRWLAATALGALAACTIPAWARHHAVLAGPIGTAALATLAALALRRTAIASQPRAGVGLAAGAMLAFVAAAGLGGGAYSDLGPLFLGQVRGLFAGSAERDAVGRLYSTVVEFQPATARFRGDPLAALARDDFGLLVLASGIAAAFASSLAGRPRDDGARGQGLARSLVGWLALVYGMLTVLFVRSLVVAAPFVAAWAGGGIALVARRKGRSRVLVLSLAGVAILSGVASLPAWRKEIGRPGPTLPPGIGVLLAQSTPEDAVIASAWTLGYEVQLFAGRASFSDGMLEDDENRRRILDVWSPGVVESPEAWAARLRSAGGTHVLVGPSIDAALALLYLGYTRAPGVEVDGSRGFRIDPLALGAGAMLRMIGGEDVSGFARRWTRPGEDGTRWSLYEIELP